MSTLAEQKTLSEVLKENTRLKNQVESLNDYVKALEEECRLAKELIAEYKRRANPEPALDKDFFKLLNVG